MQTRVRVPARRVMGLAITETADEVLIYDTERHHIHHLNATTSAVWRACDGTHDVDEIAHLASITLGERLDEATVRLALTKLDDANLLAASLPTDLRAARLSRRTLMRRAAIAGVIAVPAIVSTTAPAFAASQCQKGCGSNTDCSGGTTPYSNNTCIFCVDAICMDTGCGAGCRNNASCAPYDCKWCYQASGETKLNCHASDSVCGRTCHLNGSKPTPCPTSGTSCIYCSKQTGPGVCQSTAGFTAAALTASTNSQPLSDQSLSSASPSKTDNSTPTPTPTPTEVPPTPTEVPPTDTPTPQPPTPTPTDVPPTDTPVPTPTDVPAQNLVPADQSQQQGAGTTDQSQQDTGAAGTPSSTN